MVKIKYFIITFCFFFLFSCKRDVDPYPNGKPLDVQELVEMKYKWKTLNIKNYSFTYEFDTYRPEAYKGYVTVKDGVGSVTFEAERGSPDKNDPYRKLYYMTSVEDVFDNTADKYLLLKTKIDEGKGDYLDYHVKYNEDYFFLEDVAYTTFRPIPPGEPIPIGQNGIYFRVKDFKILD